VTVLDQAGAHHMATRSQQARRLQLVLARVAERRAQHRVFDAGL